jgi:hypothetical protein
MIYNVLLQTVLRLHKQASDTNKKKYGTKVKNGSTVIYIIVTHIWYIVTRLT